jgi:hypothetical protein
MPTKPAAVKTIQNKVEKPTLGDLGALQKSRKSCSRKKKVTTKRRSKQSFADIPFSFLKGFFVRLFSI